MQVPAHRGMQQIRQSTHNGHSSVNSNRNSFEPFHHPVDTPYVQNHNTNHTSFVGAPNFGGVSRDFDFDPAAGFFPHTALFNPSLDSESLNSHDFLLHTAPANDIFSDPSVASYLSSPGQTVHEELVMHYFSNVQKVQSFFAGEAL